MTTRDRILLALLVLSGKSTYSRVLSFLPPAYPSANYYGLLRRLEGEKQLKRAHPILRLLPAGIESLERKFGPRIRTLASSPSSEAKRGVRMHSSEVGHLWHLVIYNFPTGEAYHRSQLKYRLNQLGMGALRRGVYLSPYRILDVVAQWAQDRGVLENIFLMRSPGEASLVNRCWNLDAISRRYHFLLDRLRVAAGLRLRQKRQVSFRRIRSDFLNLLITDPLLPKSLLPPSWPLEITKHRLISFDDINT